MNNSFMSVYELNSEQLNQLKQKILADRIWDTEGRGASYGELLFADDLIEDEDVFEEFCGTIFTEDDFE